MADQRKKYAYSKQTVSGISFYTVTTGPNQGRYFTDYKQAQEYCDMLNAGEELPPETDTEENAPAISAGAAIEDDIVNRQLSFDDLL